MKLVKVRNLAQRPASNLSVIVQFLFGNQMPGEFIPGYQYKKGSTVYTVASDGLTIQLWTCNIAGAYLSTEEPYWTEFSLSAYLNERLANIVYSIYDPHPQMFDMTQFVGTYTVPTEFKNNIFDIVHTPSFMDVFYEGYLVNPNKYTIEGDTIRSDVMPSVDDVIIDNYIPSDDMSRLVRRITYTTKIGAGKSEFDLPSKDIEQYVSYGYDLYVNGKYISPEYYEEYVNEETGISYIASTNEGILTEGDDVIVNFMVSVSDNIDIVHSTLTKVIEKDMDSYDIDISSCGYINVYQTMTVYIDGKRLDSSKFHFRKGFINIKEKKNYLKRGSVLSVSVMSFVPNKYSYTDVNHEDRRYITESIYIVENNTRLVPIPFFKYNEDLDDFLIFNENGVNISSAKWFIDNNYVRYYEHDQGVYTGDTVNFKMIDRNRNTIMRTFILTAESADQNEFELPFSEEDYMFEILFYTNGCYLSPNEYTISGNVLTITHDMALSEGDRLEIIAFKYPDSYGSTVMEYKRIFVNEESASRFNLDFQYDKAVTSFLVFANTGLYIGERFYDISDDNILTIKGEEIYEGGWIDIIVIQSTEALTSADNILSLL